MFFNILGSTLAECSAALQESSDLHGDSFKELSDRKLRYHKELRCGLGEPSKQDALGDICCNEETRQKDEKARIMEAFEKDTSVLTVCGRRFAKMMSDTTEQMLLLMDNILTTEDVNVPG